MAFFLNTILMMFCIWLLRHLINDFRVSFSLGIKGIFKSEKAGGGKWLNNGLSISFVIVGFDMNTSVNSCTNRNLDQVVFCWLLSALRAILTMVFVVNQCKKESEKRCSNGSLLLPDGFPSEGFSIISPWRCVDVQSLSQGPVEGARTAAGEYPLRGPVGGCDQKRCLYRWLKRMQNIGDLVLSVRTRTAFCFLPAPGWQSMVAAKTMKTG